MTEGEARMSQEPTPDLHSAAQEVATRWFDWIEGEADQTLRAAMLDLRAALAQPEPLDAAKNVADAIGGAWSPDEAEAVARAYVAGHRDGVGCGIESAGFGFVECEHVGHLAARLTEADDE